jgi:hypothetical protein
MWHNLTRMLNCQGRGIDPQPPDSLRKAVSSESSGVMQTGWSV